MVSSSVKRVEVDDPNNGFVALMKEDGFLDDAWDEYYGRVWNQDCAFSAAILEDSENEQFSMNNMSGIFLLHYGVSFIAIMVGLIALKRKQLKRKKIAMNEAAADARVIVLPARPRTIIAFPPVEVALPR